MGRRTDKQRAAVLLVHKQHAYSIPRVLRACVPRYIFLAALVASLVLMLSADTFPSLRSVWFWAIGMFCGAIVRDFGWFRQIKRNWPFTEKVIDWEEVQRIAGEHGC